MRERERGMNLLTCFGLCWQASLQHQVPPEQQELAVPAGRYPGGVPGVDEGDGQEPGPPGGGDREGRRPTEPGAVLRVPGPIQGRSLVFTLLTERAWSDYKHCR